jgi:hypothetical protein
MHDQFVTELNLQLKPQETDMRISLKLIYIFLFHPQYIAYEVSIDSKMVCLWFTRSSVFAAELNVELKSHAYDIKISPNFTYVSISPPIDII